MWDLIDEELGKKKGAQKGETIKKYSQDLILLGRTSVPNDVASLVSFLGSGARPSETRSAIPLSQSA